MRCVHNGGTKKNPQITVTRVLCQLAKSSVPIAAQVVVEHPNIATFYDSYAPLNKGLALKPFIHCPLHQIYDRSIRRTATPFE